jgi:hypothetical protein
VAAGGSGVALAGLWFLGLPKNGFGVLVLAIGVGLAILTLLALSPRATAFPRERERGVRWIFGRWALVIALVGVGLWGLFWLGDWLLETAFRLDQPLWRASETGAHTGAPQTPGLYTVDILWRAGLVPLVVLALYLLATRFVVLGRSRLGFVVVPIVCLLVNPPIAVFPWLAALTLLLFLWWVVLGRGWQQHAQQARHP